MSDSGSDLARASTTDALPVAPSMGPTLEREHFAAQTPLVDRRTVALSAAAVVLALAAGVLAQALTRLIALVTNVAFYGRFSTAWSSPAGHHLGILVLGVPVAGGVLVGLLARFGSPAIRGHGIPEAMERVLLHQSRIPKRMTFLKPLSAAIAIGTGGPFGAEGPIIATGGALGSLIGQLLPVTAHERKTLLAAGAAAGMSATFGSPVSAVLLAVELLLFELGPRSLIPVALATATAAGVRAALVGSAAVFPMPALAAPGGVALVGYVAIGALVGVAAVLVTRAVYAVEDLFARLPIHWMWWPALGAVAVGVVGYVEPHTLGVGYDNIERIVAGTLAGRALVALCALKLVSWLIALGSGTSGGTLAPLFTIGGGLGAALGAGAAVLLPHAGVDPRVAALVGMAAIFAGASRAPLASLVFAFETTRQPAGLLPLLGGCAAAYLVSCLMMKHSIMTEKIARRGVNVPAVFGADPLGDVRVAQCGLRSVVTLRGGQSAASARAFLRSDAAGAAHQGFPVLDEGGALLGVVTRRQLDELADEAHERPVRALVTRAPVVVYEDESLRTAVERMAMSGVGRLPVLARDEGEKLVGIVTRSDVLLAYRRRVEEERRAEATVWWRPGPSREAKAPGASGG